MHHHPRRHHQAVQAHRAVQAAVPWNSTLQLAILRVGLSPRGVLHPLKKVRPQAGDTQADPIWGTQADLVIQVDLDIQVDLRARSTGRAGSQGSPDSIQEGRWAGVIQAHREEIYHHRNQKNLRRKSELPSRLKPEI